MYRSVRPDPGFRINRNIVECKAKISTKGIILKGRINRNIVECKDFDSGS